MLSSPSPGGLIAIAVVFFVLNSAAVALRFRARFKENNPVGADDWTVLASFITFTAIWIIPVIVGAVDGGLGSHLPIDPATGVQELPNQTFVNTHFTYLTFGSIPPGLGRLSILLFYRRIFVGRPFQIVNWSLIVYTILWTLIFTFLYLFKCGVPSTAVISGGVCIDIWDYLKVLGITSALSDFFILLVPWPPLVNLHMRTSQKVSIGLAFALGNMALAASIVRCIVLFQVDAVILAGQTDFTFDDGVNGVWSMVETGMIIICACLPTLGRPLWRKLPDHVQNWSDIWKTRVMRRERSYKSWERSSSSDGAPFQNPTTLSTYASAEKTRRHVPPSGPGQIGVVTEFELLHERTGPA